MASCGGLAVAARTSVMLAVVTGASGRLIAICAIAFVTLIGAACTEADSTTDPTSRHAATTTAPPAPTAGTAGATAQPSVRPSWVRPSSSLVADLAMATALPSVLPSGRLTTALPSSVRANRTADAACTAAGALHVGVSVAVVRDVGVGGPAIATLARRASSATKTKVFIGVASLNSDTASVRTSKLYNCPCIYAWLFSASSRGFDLGERQVLSAIIEMVLLHLLLVKKNHCYIVKLLNCL